MDRIIFDCTEVGLRYPRLKGLFRLEKEGFWPLQDITFQLEQGETLGIIGRNGAGKSTLLRMLAGILKPDRGSLYIKEGHLGCLLTIQVGFVGYLTGKENILLSGLLLGATRGQIRQKTREIIDYAELESFIDQPIQTYSTGMRARLGFSIAIHLDPKVLLIDEVLGVGDRQFSKKATDTLRQLIESDRTVVIVSHNTGFLKDVCSKVLWIEDGHTKMFGDPDTIIKAYQEDEPKSQVVR